MEYNEIFKFNSLLVLLILLVVLFAIILINTKLDIILYSDINNSDISVKLNIKYMFSLIDITKQIYPLKANKNNKEKNKENIKKKKQKKGNNKVSITLNEIKKIYKLVRSIKVQEVYSNIEFGTEYIQLTSFIYVLVNSIYGILANYINPIKMYLGVKPNFTENYITGSIKVHIEITIKELIIIAIDILKIVIKNKRKTKGGKKNEGNGINTKLNGNNA